MNVNQQLTAERTRDVEWGKRFEFGRKWSEFLRTLNQDRLGRAEKSLQQTTQGGDPGCNGFVCLEP